MTRSDFFKSVAGALAIFGVAKAVKPEDFVYGKIRFYKKYGVWMQTRTDRKGNTFMRYAAEAEIWSTWEPLAFTQALLRRIYSERRVYHNPALWERYQDNSVGYHEGLAKIAEHQKHLFE